MESRAAMSLGFGLFLMICGTHGQMQSYSNSLRKGSYPTFLLDFRRGEGGKVDQSLHHWYSGGGRNEVMKPPPLPKIPTSTIWMLRIGKVVLPF